MRPIFIEGEIETVGGAVLCTYFVEFMEQRLPDAEDDTHIVNKYSQNNIVEGDGIIQSNCLYCGDSFSQRYDTCRQKLYCSTICGHSSRIKTLKQIKL